VKPQSTISRAGFVTATLWSPHQERSLATRHAAAAALRHRSSFGSKDPQGGSGDEVALKVEGVVNRGVHA
jgi:hypothetical protein